MASKTEIANVALVLIGGTRITSFTDGSKNADTLNDIYEDLRRNLLAFPWNFASTRVELAQLVNDPAFEYEHAYGLPADWLYTVSVHDNDAGAGSIVFKEEQQDSQNVLLANEEKVFLRYTRDEQDVNLWSSNFKRAVSTALARDLAIPIANSNTLHAIMEARATRALSKAQATDAITSFPERRPRGTWVSSRGGRRGSIH